MKLISVLSAAAYKQLVTVDLPNKGSRQHELNGVGALKDFFKTENALEGFLTWVYFRDADEPLTERGKFKFYDARAKSSMITGRSEWRLYYQGEFLARARVGDLFILTKSRTGELFALVFPKDSEVFHFARGLFGIRTGPLKFDSVPFEALSSLPIPEANKSSVSRWLSQLLEGVPRPRTESPPSRTQSLPFKPRARMLMLLGDQLIRDTGIAVFELVKNAYDADATKAHVTLSDVKDIHNGRVIIEDDGFGMSWDQIVNVWLEPGTDHRQRQKAMGYRTPKFNRLPLGEKGVGRFAAHKLGKKIKLLSRQEHSPEVVVEIDWNAFANERYLQDAKVNVSERPPQHFLGAATGTRIEISDLNEELSRGIVRQIFRSINSISSPFRGPSEFAAELTILPPDNSVVGLLNIAEVLDIAPYRATCLISQDRLTYDYDFTPPANMDRISGRSVRQREMPVPPLDLFSMGAMQSLVGPILIEFRIYDLDSKVLAYSVSDKKGFKDFLKQNGGVRVYRDGVRVYDYGETGNDWLDLGGSRVNDPTAKVSVNQIIGAVHLDGSQSAALREKTNREGFIEDETFRLFRESVRFALTQVVFERNTDKTRLRQLYSAKRQKQPVLGELAELRIAIERIPSVAGELIPLVDSVEAKYVEMRDTLMTAAGAGLTLSVVIHEVEKAIQGLAAAVERNTPLSDLRDLAVHLNELIEGLTNLTRKSGRKSEQFGNLISQTLRNTNYRTKAHGILVVNGVEAGDPDISVHCTKRLIIATLMNLMDNSIYWLSTQQRADKRIYIGSSTNIPGGPVLFVADNGPGFQDEPFMLIQPFMSRKPDGMGLGLHVASTVMESHDGGRLIFPTAGDLGLSDQYCGAIVGLQFKEIK